MNKKMIAAISAVLAVSMLFAACGQKEPTETTQVPETTAAAESTVPTETPETTEAATVPETGAAEATEATETAEPAETSTVNVYIGRKNSGFQAYPVELQGELSPEALIAGIESLTGWNLSLTEPVTMGKGGMTVVLSEESALVVGPPAEQKEEFWMYDVDTLVITVLDSIQETLRRNFVGENGNPDLLDIYFSLAGGDVDLENTSIHYSQYEPWDSLALTD